MPETKPMGSKAAITVNVARMVGLPTSATASMVVCVSAPAVDQPAAIDIFNHHNRVIDQNTNGEDQSKQRHTVNGKAQDIGGEHREQDDHGNDQRPPQEPAAR